ncbi:hypothetical protein PF66_01749 [Pseudomonas asplenii]|uniref:Uncharacterized protein n=1 Tax=Pseudomonas asplenii TaxID=53407 RepID=A0A0N0E4V3_9PSED|nr:hypothetical protein PF66_01749 [Pseudomonas fuscovaginae]
MSVYQPFSVKPQAPREVEQRLIEALVSDHPDLHLISHLNRSD